MFPSLFRSFLFIVFSISTLAVTAQSRKIDVWDFGGVPLVSPSANNFITKTTLDDWEAVTAGKFSAGNFVFGDLTLNAVANDRLYYFEGETPGKRGYGLQGYAAFDFGDGYVSHGLYYCNGTGGEARRYLLIANVQAGDRITFYARNSNAATDTVHFAQVGDDGKKTGLQDETAPITADSKAYVYAAKAAGSYKIYTDAVAGKPVYYRVVRTPAVVTKGKLDRPAGLTGYGLKLVNQTNKQEIAAEVDSQGNWTAALTPGYDYAATLTGAVGFGVSMATKMVSVTDADVTAGRKEGLVLKVDVQKTYTIAGRLVGIDAGFAAGGVKITWVAPKGTNHQPVPAVFDPATRTFRATLEPDVKYTLVLEGANDYSIKAGGTVEGADDLKQDLVVEPKPRWTASGRFTNLPEGATLASLEFKHLEDGAVYPGTLTASGYTAQLRDGAYEAKLTSATVATSGHVVVAGAAVTKDLRVKILNPAPVSLKLVKDLYVGNPTKTPNFATVREALATAAAMNPTKEEDRITLHFAPGVYREQVIVRTPYLSFVNDTPGQEVKLTWYYGIGYKYYSAGEDGYYSEEAAADRFSRRTVARWGAATSILPPAVRFRAQGITFETSFSKYVTDEELADGVVGDGTTTFVRKLTSDVASKAAGERSAALAAEADFGEFVNCRIVGSQDTLFTGSNNHLYFRGCTIEGNTDYIFGDGDVVFDLCHLVWCGYSDTASGGYLTAAKDTAPKGYLFRECVVSAQADRVQAPGFWGRPWGAGARVTFWNTRLAAPNLLAPAGWTAMSGNTPEKARFQEIGTTWNDQGVDVGQRVAGTTGTTTPNVREWLGSWTPTALVEPVTGPATFAAPLAMTSSDDLNTPYPGHRLTVHYQLAGAAADSSLIQWFRVPKTGDPVLAAVSVGPGSHSYRISGDDVGSSLRVVVTPRGFQGPAGPAQSFQTEVVRPGTVAVRNTNAVETGLRVPGKVNVFLAGDSTVKDYSAYGMHNARIPRDEGSWGEFLQAFFDGSRVNVVNWANGGRSTRNFINEGSLQKIADQIGRGDLLLIQFGHNDSANQIGSLEDRHVPLGIPDAQGIYPVQAGPKVASPASYASKYGPTFYSWDNGATFKWYLLQYLEVARKAGATPVLVTPVSRQYFDGNGLIRPHHDATDPASPSPLTQGNAYVQAVRQLAQEQKVALIDAFEATKGLYEQAWKAAPGTNALAVQTMFPGDSTHSNKLGGVLSAALVARSLADLKLGLETTVAHPSRVLGENSDGRALFHIKANGEFQATDPYWTRIGQDLIDRFGHR